MLLETLPSADRSAVAAAAGGRCLRLTLQGFSPVELKARAVHECACHFRDCPWTLEQAEFEPRLSTIGGRVRLYEGRFVASAQRFLAG